MSVSGGLVPAWLVGPCGGWRPGVESPGDKLACGGQSLDKAVAGPGRQPPGCRGFTHTGVRAIAQGIWSRLAHGSTPSGVHGPALGH